MPFNTALTRKLGIKGVYGCIQERGTEAGLLEEEGEAVQKEETEEEEETGGKEERGNR